MTHHGKARENFIKGCEKCPSIRLPHLPRFPSIRAINSVVEYQTFNLGVAGSSPAWRTIKRILAKRDTSPVFLTPYAYTFPFPLSVGRARLRPPSICGSWLIAGSIPASRRVHFSFFSFLYPVRWLGMPPDGTPATRTSRHQVQALRAEYRILRRNTTWM